MDDILLKAIDFARQIQNTDEYMELKKAKEANDCDDKLQNLINEFNLLKLKVQKNYLKENEVKNVDESEKNKENEKNSVKLSEIYDKIMDNENMKKFNAASESMNSLMNKINKILMAAVNGKKFDILSDLDDDESCNGNCEGCSGCF